jgi:HlyD family secretion protein
MAAPSICYLRDIQALFDTGTASNLSDRQLLETFLSNRDGAAETAFEALVLRHGPMVLRVCTIVLQDPTDAEDAFQATFLILVRSRRSIRRLESIGSWLYGVAHRVASRVRLDAARRRAAERHRGLRIMVPNQQVDGADPDGGEFAPVVQQEVQRLPEKYRSVVVLCYWQGLNQEQAAARLGCPLGTVRSRLARARNLLHRRLTRRGLAPLAAMLTIALDRNSATAGVLRLAPVPPQLIQSTIRAACQLAAGQATAQVVSVGVASLVQRVFWSMAMTKISCLGVGVVLVGLIGYGAGLAAQQTRDVTPIQSPVRSSVGQASPEDPGAKSPTRKNGQPAPADGDQDRSGDAAVFSKVSGNVLTILPTRSIVKKGDVICKLDSAALNDQLTNQRITTESAKAVYQNAKLAREDAEIAVVEYEEGLYKMRLEEIAGDIKVAEAELALAEDQLKWVKELVSRNVTSEREARPNELAVLRAKIGLEKAQRRHKTLRDFTGPKKIKALKSSVETNRSNELAKQAMWELQTGKEKKLERLIAACTIVAPRDGVLRHGFGVPGAEPEVREVRERQLLFRIAPATEPNPKAK